jgi:uncharacterized protein YybS (DUF2232 family)
MIYRYGLKKGLLMLAVAYIGLSLIYPAHFNVALIFAQFGSVGLFFGLLFRNKIKAGTSLFGGVLLAALITLSAMILITTMTGLTLGNIETQIVSQFDESLKIYQKTYELSTTEQQELRQSMQAMATYVVRLLPGILVLGAMLSTMLTFFITRVIMARLGHEILPLLPFSQWTYPWYTVWGAIFGLALTIAGDRYGWLTTAIIGKNLLYVFGFTFLLLGIAVAVYYYQRLSLPRFIKWLLLLFIIFLPVTPYILAVIGVLDPLVDVRRLNKKKV